MTFQIAPLPMTSFAPLFGLPDVELAARGIVRRVADGRPAFPCRVSLRDAREGESLLLLHYEHHAAPSPFRSSYAIYVGEGAEPAQLAPGEVPAMLRSRLLSVRAFDRAGMLVEADIAPGTELEGLITRLFATPSAAYLHVHFAKPGCYAARVDRA
jgi:hypothetical protein